MQRGDEETESRPDSLRWGQPAACLPGEVTSPLVTQARTFAAGEQNSQAGDALGARMRDPAPRLPPASGATAGTAWTTTINRCGAIIARVFKWIGG